MCAILGFTSPSLKKEQVLPYFEKTKSRGPDDTRLEPAGSGMHRAAGAMVWVPKPPVPDRQATLWPTFRCVTPSPTACTTPAYSEPGTKGRGGFI